MKTARATCDRCGAEGPPESVRRVAVAILDGPLGRPLYTPEGPVPGAYPTGGCADLCSDCLERGMRDFDRLIRAWRKATSEPAESHVAEAAE